MISLRLVESRRPAKRRAATKPVQNDTPERFQKLTGHLRISGKPLESKVFALAAERAKGLQVSK